MLNLVKGFEIIVGAAFGKNVGSPMPKQTHAFRKTKSSRQYARFFGLSIMACQIDVVNKQPVSSLS